MIYASSVTVMSFFAELKAGSHSQDVVGQDSVSNADWWMLGYVFFIASHRETLELTRSLADYSATTHSLPSILCFGNCDVSEPSVDSSGIRSLAVRISMPTAVLRSSASSNSRSMGSKKAILGFETEYNHSCMWKEAKRRNFSKLFQLFALTHLIDHQIQNLLRVRFLPKGSFLSC